MVEEPPLYDEPVTGKPAELVRRCGQDVILRGRTLRNMPFEQPARLYNGELAVMGPAEVLVAPEFDSSLRMSLPRFKQAIRRLPDGWLEKHKAAPEMEE